MTAKPAGFSDGRPRVLFLNSCVSGGGPGRGLSLYFREAGNRIEAHVAMPEPGVVAPTFPADVQTHYVPEWLERPLRPPYQWLARRRGWNLLGGVAALTIASFKLGVLARRLRPQVIYCNHMLAKPIGALIGSLLGIPVVFHARNIHDQRWLEKSVFQTLAKLPAVHRVLANSQATAAPFVAVVPDKVRVIANFVDLRSFDRPSIQGCLRREMDWSADVPIIGYLGRIAHWKGVGVLLDAFAKVASLQPEAQMVIVGETDSGSHRDLRAEYEAQARRLGLQSRVHFVGFRDDVRPYLVDFDVLALPSTAPEPFGRVLIEAMALGVPPVITAHGGAMEVVRDCIDGLWAAPRDAADFATKLQQMLADPARRRALGEQAQQRVRLHFSSETLAAQITENLMEVANSARWAITAAKL